jgi:nucleotide-binding universal stress UspA family protein
VKTIIACTDFSPIADNAVSYAAALASATHARLLLYHHFTYPIPASDLPGYNPGIFVDEAAAGYEARLREVKKALLGRYQIEVDYVVRSFDLNLDLETLFKNEEGSLVVMGLKGQSALVSALFGSVAISAIRRAKLPLLLIPEEAVFHPLKKILFPFDDQTIASTAILQPLCDLATNFDAYIEVITLFDLEKTPTLAPKHALSAPKIKLDDILSGIRHGFTYENEDVVSNGILYEAARSSANLVAMIPHHRSFLVSLLNQSHTQQIAASIDLPLLVLGGA